MKKHHAVGMLHFLLVLSFTAHAAEATPTRNAAELLVKKGEYLARAADCNSCHTGSKDKPYAGGLGLKSVYGIIYSTNITSDKATGIGSWTKADFVRSLREGVRKDGAYLYPAMPYTSYTKINDADLDALWAYISQLPAIKNDIPKNTLPFPLSVRSGMAVWQSLYLTEERFVPVPSKDATWNRGAYLVEAFGHCSDCHTPRNVAQGPESAHLLSGAQIEGWYAPDISSNPNSKIAYWNVTDLAKFLKTGTTPDNANAFGPMQEVVHDSLQFLTNADLQAMAVYLKDQSTGATPRSASKVYLPRIEAGKLVYENNCLSCHQSDGKGINSTVPALAGNDAVKAAEPYNVIMAMLEGFQPQGNWGAMASFANSLSDDQISDVANYIRTAWGNDAPGNATPWSVANWRKNAELPATGAAAMLCPNLAKDVIEPALKNPPDVLRQAARDTAKMSSLVSSYRTARPNAPKSEVIEALSTAYCRVVTADKITQARMGADIADFAQRVAQVPMRSTPAT